MHFRGVFVVILLALLSEELISAKRQLALRRFKRQAAPETSTTTATTLPAAPATPKNAVAGGEDPYAPAPVAEGAPDPDLPPPVQASGPKRAKQHRKIAVGITAPPGSDFKMMCNWGKFYHDEIRGFPIAPENVPPHMCSHLIFNVAWAHKDHTISAGSDRDESWNGNEALGLYRRLNNLKTQNPKLKTYLAIGGRTNPYNFFLTIATMDNRRKFAVSVTDYLRKWNFDGLVIDLHYSVHQPKFHYLCKDTRHWFERDGRENQMAALELLAVMDDRTIKKIGKCLNYLILNTYDYARRWPPGTRPYAGTVAEIKAPLPRVKNSVEIWKKMKVPKKKLIVGLSTFGRTYELADEDNTDVGSDIIRHGKPGMYSQHAGYIYYYEICYRHVKEHWDEEWDYDSQAPFTYKGLQWISYDNQISLNLKVEYILKAGLGGACIWELSQDDLQNHCGAGKYPLLETVHEKLFGEKWQKYNWKPPKFPHTPYFGTTRRRDRTSRVQIEFAKKRPEDRPEGNWDSKYGGEVGGGSSAASIYHAYAIIITTSTFFFFLARTF